MSVRESFVKKFGEDQAQAIEDAAACHRNMVSSNRPGSDPFKWAILMAISFECFTKTDYRTYHKITAPAQEIKDWAKNEGELATHDGDFDYLGMFSGAFDEYMPKAKA